MKRLDYPTRDNNVRRTTHSNELANEGSDPGLDYIEGYLSDAGSTFSMTRSCMYLESFFW